MLNTQKLLYITPELAYIAELLPGKKPNTFSVHSFHQINGEFIGDNELIADNVVKLFSKIDPDDYHVILPDFLFTNTIINVADKSEAKIQSYLHDEYLPKLGLKPETHDIKTTVLTEFKGNSKVQISALEKSLIAPIRVGATQHDCTVTAISPLSWTIKALVSLEPSISVLQMGNRLYTAFHYIGVDQTTIVPLDDMEQIVETIKTLKGSEASIQTVYLLSNELVEDYLKEHLSSTLPIQQLNIGGEDDTKMPSYVKQIIEAGARTLSIPDFPVPQFPVGKTSEDELADLATTPSPVSDEDADEEAEPALPSPTPAPALAEPEEELAIEPAEEPELLEVAEPETIALESGNGNQETVDFDNDVDETDSETDTDTDTKTEIGDGTAIAAAAIATVAATAPVIAAPPIIEPPAPVIQPPTPQTKAPEINTMESGNGKQETDSNNNETDTNTETVDQRSEMSKEDETEMPAPTSSNLSRAAGSHLPATDDVDISQFAQHATTTSNSQTQESKPTNDDQSSISTHQSLSSQPVIKNKSGIGSMLKMIGITIVVFVITVAIGIGVGLAVLNFTNRSATTAEPTPAPETVEATPEPTPSPTPAPEIAVADMKILIVNATTKAGYAGTVKTALTTAGYGTVATGNAKGEYEPGTYVLMKTEDTALVSKLETDSKKTLTFQDTISTEDAAGTYDAVIVLAE